MNKVGRWKEIHSRFQFKQPINMFQYEIDDAVVMICNFSIVACIFSYKYL